MHKNDYFAENATSVHLSIFAFHARYVFSFKTTTQYNKSISTAHLNKNSRCTQLSIKKLFSLRVNTPVVSDGQCRFTGKPFHVIGPHTLKFLCPRTVHVRGTTEVWPAADRKWLIPGSDDTNVQVSARYDGANPWNYLKTVIANLSRIRWRTGSQWSSRMAVILGQNNNLKQLN